MKKLLMAALAATALIGTCAAMAVAGEGYGGAPPSVETVIGADGKIRFYETDNGFAPVADECKQTLEEAAGKATSESWQRLGSFDEPEHVLLLAGYLSMRMGKPVSGDLVTAFDRGPEGLLMLTDKGCVVGIVGGLKEVIEKALTEFRNSVPAA